MKKIKPFIWGAALIFLFIICRTFWFSYHKSQGFSVSKMTASIPHEEKWGLPKLSIDQEERLKDIFQQRFHFFSSGYQSYAFISEDERTIIKFFRMKRLSHSMTDPFFHPQKVGMHKKNLHLIFDAYKLAYDEMREDAGLIYIHLNQTNFLKTEVAITDQEGNDHRIDLDKVHFIVQEKAEPLFVHLHKYIEKKDKEGFDKAIDALIALIKRRHEKGIGDEDRGIAENYGFIGDRPIQFDIGRIYKGKFEGEFEEIFRRLHWWMELNPIP